MLGDRVTRRDSNLESLIEMTKLSFLAPLPALPLLLLLAACGPTSLAVGAGATAVTAAQSEKGLGVTLADAEIELLVSKRLADASGGMFWKIDTEVEEGRVLLAGQVESVEQRLEAVRVTWDVEGVREVINEISLSTETGSRDVARDAWIAAKLDTKLLFDKEVSSIDYSVETVRQVIYLMGIARSQAELDRVIGHARDIAYVKRVVSYVRVKSKPRALPPEEVQAEENQAEAAGS